MRGSFNNKDNQMNHRQPSFIAPILLLAAFLTNISMSIDALEDLGAKYYSQVLGLSMMAGVIVIVTRMRNTKFVSPDIKRTALFFITFAIFPMAMEIPLTIFLGEVSAPLNEGRTDILAYALYALTAAFYFIMAFNFGEINNSVENNS